MPGGGNDQRGGWVGAPSELVPDMTDPLASAGLALMLHSKEPTASHVGAVTVGAFPSRFHYRSAGARCPGRLGRRAGQRTSSAHWSAQRRRSQRILWHAACRCSCQRNARSRRPSGPHAGVVDAVAQHFDAHPCLADSEVTGDRRRRRSPPHECSELVAGQMPDVGAEDAEFGQPQFGSSGADFVEGGDRVDRSVEPPVGAEP